MSGWSLRLLLAGLHEEIEKRLEIARRSFAHPGTKGDASEAVWLELLQTYLPTRYQVVTAHVVDSEGAFSDQIDIIVFDRQYSPFIFRFQGQTIVPAESVYAVFEAKQAINATQVSYAHQKVASVRRLHRTSLPIPHAAILGGLLTFESDWNPPLGQPLIDALSGAEADERLDLGCVAANGLFSCDQEGCFSFALGGKPATAFLLELIGRLQASATVPMIDVRAYARWLAQDE
jgi:hypothetical protein